MTVAPCSRNWWTSGCSDNTYLNRERIQCWSYDRYSEYCLYLRDHFPTMVWVLCRDWKLGASPPYPETLRLSQLVQSTSHRLSRTDLQPWICRYTKGWTPVCLPVHPISTASENVALLSIDGKHVQSHILLQSEDYKLTMGMNGLFKLIFSRVHWLHYTDSVGLRFGFSESRSTHYMLPCFNSSEASFDMCLGLLFCWNTKMCQSFNYLAVIL